MIQFAQASLYYVTSTNDRLKMLSSKIEVQTCEHFSFPSFIRKPEILPLSLMTHNYKCKHPRLLFFCLWLNKCLTIIASSRTFSLISRLLLCASCLHKFNSLATRLLLFADIIFGSLLSLTFFCHFSSLILVDDAFFVSVCFLRARSWEIFRGYRLISAAT